MKFYNPFIFTQKCHRYTFLMKPFLFLFLVLQLVVCPLRGQALQKKKVEIENYSLWSDIRLNGVSPEGKWVSYLLAYDSGLDTLFVKSTTSDKVYNFTGINHYQFLKKERFVSLSNGDLNILNLKNGSSKNISDVKNYSYSAETDQLVILVQHGNNSTLRIIDSKDNLVKKMESISFFLLSPDGRKIVYVSKSENLSSLGILELKSGFPQKTLIEKSPENWDYFVWKQSIAFSFLRRYNQDSQASISYYNFEENALFVFNPLLENAFPKNKLITNDFRYPIAISSDLKRVFFCIKPLSDGKKAKIKTDPEIWYTKTKQIYSQQQKSEPFSDKPSLAVWFPLTGKFEVISSEDFSDVLLTGDQQYALLSDPLAHEPGLEYDTPRDFYLKNLTTGKQEFLVKNIKDFRRSILPSPTGKYIAYFSEDNWWVYNISKKSHKNITEKINTVFSGLAANMDLSYPFGNPGWTDGDSEILLYDRYDIWAVKPDGAFRRLTSGQKKQIQFRFAYNLGGNFRLDNYDGCISSTINISKGAILDAEGSDVKSGYFEWNETNKEQPIVYEPASISQIHFIKETNSYIYQTQDFNRSPSLVYKAVDRTPYIFFESNKHQSGYYWGHSEHIDYKNSKGSSLRAGLYYPACYDPQKKYPMIVHIYEKQSQKIHKYYKPTLFEAAGFNPAVLSLEGYFVLCPDIEYETGKTGESALDCVTAATSAVIEKGLVDPDKIGLMGHSFGGYETAYISGKTDIFAASVAGAAPIDLNSFYHAINWRTGKPHMIKFNIGQFRLGVSAYEMPLTYLNNSPLNNVENINKPLLFWSGKNDQQVDWHQSIELYLAMHRLEKNNIMLLYPEEEHSFSDPYNQKDLSIRILQWFNHFLKNEKAFEWIENRG